MPYSEEGFYYSDYSGPGSYAYESDYEDRYDNYKPSRCPVCGDLECEEYHDEDEE